MRLTRRRHSGATTAMRPFTQAMKTVQDGEVIKCSDCEDVLSAGTEYGVIDGEILCEECIDEIPYCDIVTRMGHDWNTASEEDIYDGYDD